MSKTLITINTERAQAYHLQNGGDILVWFSNTQNSKEYLMASLWKTESQKGRQKRTGLTSSSLLCFHLSHQWICSGCSYQRSVEQENGCSTSTSWSRQEKVYESQITASVLALSHGVKLHAVNLSSPGTTGCWPGVHRGYSELTESHFSMYKYL